MKTLYHRRAERLRELAENNPLANFLRFAALVATRRKWCCTTTTANGSNRTYQEANEQGKPPLDIHACRATSTGTRCCISRLPS
ncbi:formate dehydrogenase accessory protein FdhE [Shigella flexneri]